MTFEIALETCRSSELRGWALVEFAQRLVCRSMTYSTTNSLDSPLVAFEKGQGYCWHRASILNRILRELGFDSRLVHAYKNLFPESELCGVQVKNFISGHVWCRVTLDGVEKDVCPGRIDNKPGVLHFTPLGRIREWNRPIELLSYYGSALVNRSRTKKYETISEKLENRWKPEYCPCKKTSCLRYKKCDECREYHYAKKSLPYCERNLGYQTADNRILKTADKTVPAED